MGFDDLTIVLFTQQNFVMITKVMKHNDNNVKLVSLSVSLSGGWAQH